MKRFSGVIDHHERTGTSMNIAIIGAGNVGKALAGSFVKAGNAVTVSSEHAATAATAAGETGAMAAPSNSDAVAGADLVVLAVPYPALPGILDEVGGALRGKVVVDATNPLRADYTGLTTEGTSAAEEIQAHAPGARVVKAFNSALAARQADPTVEGVQADGFVAGDDEDAKRQVLDLVGSIGFRPIDAGPLEMARALEAMALLNITLQLRNSWPWQSAWKLVGPTG
jgi:8-hydroxy-5-deazaflavin:NADPH oxidoreductase